MPPTWHPQQPHFTGRLLNKVAIVTGSASGLGRAIALTYIQEGAKVVYADVTPHARKHGATPETLELLSPSVRRDLESENTSTTFELLNKEGREGRVMEMLTDVSKAEDVKVLVEKTIERFGRVDMCVLYQ